jgi:hypothetical protein
MAHRPNEPQHKLLFISKNQMYGVFAARRRNPEAKEHELTSVALSL